MENDPLFRPASLFIVCDESIIYKRCTRENIFFLLVFFFIIFPQILKMEPIFNIFTESKLILLASREATKLRRVVGARNCDFTGKPMDQENGGLVSQRTVFPKLEFSLLLH